MAGKALVLGERARRGRVGEQDEPREQREPGGASDRSHVRDPRERKRGDEARGHERDSDPQQGLGRVTGELLKRKRVAQGRSEAQGLGVAHHVQPSEPGGDRPRRDQPRRRRALRAAAIAAALAWVAAGVWGLASYGHDYYRYRGFEPPADPPGVERGRLVKQRFWSPALHQLRAYLIYLPPGYDRAAAAGTRFPVLYLLHGSPGDARLFVDAAGVGVVLDRLVASHVVRPFLIAMPTAGDGSFLGDTEWADTPHGRYESYVLDTVHAVDARWPTIADRSGRGLAGNSEGAYGAVNVALRHLDLFSLAESWSGYFAQTRTGPFARASTALVAANSPTFYVDRLRAELARLPFAAYVYAGGREHAARGDRLFALLLARAGGRVSVRILPGGHNWALWRRQAPASLRFAGDWFASVR